jgi:transcriptional regulator with XRE-family HTH domain
LSKRAQPLSISTPADHVGALLREWRAARRLSQLELALEAGVSSRHLSYVESGKAQPSRDMVALLADALGMPLRERNALLVAAGYAPEYAETALTTPELAPVRHAIELILEHQEPYPAFVINRRWDVLQANRAAARIAAHLGVHSAHSNMIRQLCDPNDLRAHVTNWEEVAGDLIRHLHDEIAVNRSDGELRALLDEALRYPGIPASWRTRQLGAIPAPLLTTEFLKNGERLRFFGTLTTFGTPRDVTLEELRIECSFPIDEVTAERCRALARADANPA